VAHRCIKINQLNERERGKAGDHSSKLLNSSGLLLALHELHDFAAMRSTEGISMGTSSGRRPPANVFLVLRSN